MEINNYYLATGLREKAMKKAIKETFNTQAPRDHNFDAQTEFYIRQQSYDLEAALQEGDALYLDYPYAEGTVRVLANDTPTDIAAKLYDARALKPRLEGVKRNEECITARRTDSEAISVYRLALDAVRLAKRAGSDIVFMFGDVSLRATAQTQAEDIEAMFAEDARTLTSAQSKKPSRYENFEGKLPSAGSFYVRQPHSRPH